MKTVKLLRGVAKIRFPSTNPTRPITLSFFYHCVTDEFILSKVIA
jgi:hypothetical protein